MYYKKHFFKNTYRNHKYFIDQHSLSRHTQLILEYFLTAKHKNYDFPCRWQIIKYILDYHIILKKIFILITISDYCAKVIF